jgi:hypothetical protein
MDGTLGSQQHGGLEESRSVPSLKLKKPSFARLPFQFNQNQVNRFVAQILGQMVLCRDKKTLPR